MCGVRVGVSSALATARSPDEPGLLQVSSQWIYTVVIRFEAIIRLWGIWLHLTAGASGILEQCCILHGDSLVCVWTIHFYATRSAFNGAGWLQRGCACSTAAEYHGQARGTSLCQICAQALSVNLDVHKEETVSG